MNPGQTAPLGAVWSEFIVFASQECFWIYAADHYGLIRLLPYHNVCVHDKSQECIWIYAADVISVRSAFEYMQQT